MRMPNSHTIGTLPASIMAIRERSMNQKNTKFSLALNFVGAENKPYTKKRAKEFVSNKPAHRRLRR